jgi:H+-translocating NAD(P) transhydrogenase subunit alpha
MTQTIVTDFIILVLAIVIGFELISRVPSLLHTPLMSATNAIHGIVVVGAIAVVIASEDTVTTVLGLIAVIFGAINVVGGFIVTDRMLYMFGTRRGSSARRSAR